MGCRGILVRSHKKTVCLRGASTDVGWTGSEQIPAVLRRTQAHTPRYRDKEELRKVVRTVDFPGRACLACRGACGNNSGRWEEGRGFGGKVGVPTPQTGISWDLRYWSLLGAMLVELEQADPDG